jgi:hypothetical protein
MTARPAARAGLGMPAAAHPPSSPGLTRGSAPPSTLDQMAGSSPAMTGVAAVPGLGRGPMRPGAGQGVVA